MLKKYHLEDKNYFLLHRKHGAVSENNPGGAINDSKTNASNHTYILHLLEVLEFEQEQIEIVHKILAAIILIGEIGFIETDDNGSEVNNPELVNKGTFSLFKNSFDTYIS